MKKYLTYGSIVSLVIAGFLGINVLLNGNFDETQVKTLLTTLTFTFYSIVGLSCNSIIGGRYTQFGKIGLGVAFIGLIYAVITTWATPESETFLQIRFSLFIISICFAHCSLLLLVKPYNSTITLVRTIAILSSALAALISVNVIFNLDFQVETFLLLGVVSIVGVITTIIAPILAATANNAGQTNSENITED